MAFEVPLMMIQQTIATSSKKEALAKLRESHVKNAIEQCRAFIYQVDNMVRQSIDALFGSNLYPSSILNKTLTFLLTIALLIIWVFFLIRTISVWRQDHDYQYYYHEEPRFYMLAFKWIAPFLMVIPLLGLGYGTLHAPKGSAANQPAVAMQATANNTNSWMNNLKNSSQPNQKHKKFHIGSMADSDPNFVNQMIAAKQADVATYTEIQANTKVATTNKKRLSLVKYTEPHFKLSAYKNQRQISMFIFMVYALIFTDFFMLALLIWHDNSSADQW